jgi:hypothetical protein
VNFLQVAFMTVKSEIERSILVELLESWHSGVIDEREVHEQAESIMDQAEGLPNYVETDPRSIAMEVLVQLDILYHQLITTEDIPIMQEFLATPFGKEAEAWVRWRQYWNILDLRTRRLQLQSNPYYST